VLVDDSGCWKVLPYFSYQNQSIRNPKIISALRRMTALVGIGIVVTVEATEIGDVELNSDIEYCGRFIFKEG
jgi:hypothetical protein